MTPILLADDVGPGGTAFFIVLALIVVTIGIFFALFGSLKRLKQNVAKGNFGDASAEPSAAPTTAPTTDVTTKPVKRSKAAKAANAATTDVTNDVDGVTPGPGGRGGAGA